MPSRGSFNTGLYPHAARVRHNPVVLPADAPTLAERLSGAGYDTAGFGHIGGDGVERGFRRKVDFVDQPLRGAYQREQEAILSRGPHSAGACGVHPFALEAQFDTLATDLAVEFLRGVRSPFYLQLDFMRPHIPWFVPEPYASRYDPSTVLLPDSWRDDLADKPGNVRGTRIATWMERCDAAVLQRSLAHYFGLIAYIDAQVGRLLVALEARGLLEDTVVMFTADHGDYAGEFGLVGKTGQFYDCLTRVPWIVRAPHGLVPEGRTCAGLVELVDLVPTALELLGQPASVELQGRSRVALAQGTQTAGADAVFASTCGNTRPGELVAYDHVLPAELLRPFPTDPYSSGPCSHVHDAVMVRDDRYKLSFYRDGGMELYDLVVDPGERRNLARDPAHAGSITTLLGRIARWQMESWLPDVPQSPLPYHYRSAARETIPQQYRAARDAWNREHGD